MSEKFKRGALKVMFAAIVVLVTFFVIRECTTIL